MAVANIRSQVQNASNDLVQLEKSLNDYVMKLDEGRDYLLEFISQVSAGDTVEAIQAAKIKSLLETTANRISVVQNKIQETGSLLGDEVPRRLQKIDGFINSISVEDQTPQVVHHIIDIGRNLEDISPRIPDLSKNLQQMEVPLGDIRSHMDTLMEKLNQAVGA
jgi:capsule polysaccharide export protein KpsE/RkpR